LTLTLFAEWPYCISATVEMIRPVALRVGAQSRSGLSIDQRAMIGHSLPVRRFPVRNSGPDSIIEFA
jgi:hypothetical protein